MAGIGFELRRAIGKGSLSKSVGAAFSGVFVVAGPWVLSVMAMSAISLSLARAGSGIGEPFQAAVIYCYAFSLALFAGIHHHFTRIAADLLWLGRPREASGWALAFVGLVVTLSALPSAVVAAAMPLDMGSGETAYRASIPALFVSVNALWIAMLLSSALKDFRAVMAVFALGMAVSAACSFPLASLAGPGGAVFAHALGHVAATAGLLILSFRKHPPERPPRMGATFLRYGRRYFPLLASGFFLYASQWVDKLIFWYFRGIQVVGTPFRLMPAFDVATYRAGLSVIPGLLYFVVFSETEISAAARRFAGTMNRSSWRAIGDGKREIRRTIRREMGNLALIQTAFSLAFLWASVSVDPESAAISAFSFSGALAQFCLLSTMNFMYYFELYGCALGSALTFFSLNALAFSPLTLAIPAVPPGAGHAAAAMLSAILAWFLLMRNLGHVDRLAFARSARPS